MEEARVQLLERALDFGAITRVYTARKKEQWVDSFGAVWDDEEIEEARKLEMLVDLRVVRKAPKKEKIQ